VDTFVYDTIAPTFSSLTTATVIESSTGTVYDAQTTEGDTGMSYTLSGGVDANLFNINATTGAVTFKSGPSFNTPLDAGKDNVYNFTVRATDLAGNTADRAVAITVNKAGTLDNITGSAAATYSLRRVDADYTGFAIQVRRSDGNTSNIGFTASGDLNTAALLTFVGAGNGFVTTWYDQSGNGRNATQTGNLTRQPQIVTNGVLETQDGRAAVKLATSVLNLTTSIGFTSGNGYVGAVGSQLSSQLNAPVVSYGSGMYLGFLGTSSVAFRYRNPDAAFSGPPASDSWSVNNPLNTSTLMSYAINGTADVKNYINGSLVWNDTQATSFNSVIAIGGDHSGQWNTNGRVQEVVIFNSAFGTTDRQTLEINQGLYYDTSVSAGLFGLWQSDGAGGSGTATTTNLLQTWSAQLVSHASQTNDAGTFNGSAPLSQYINRVTGTDIVSDTEFKAGFTITGKAAAGMQGTIGFYLDNDRTNGTDEIGTQLTNGSNGVSWTYNPTTGDYTISFAAGSTALKQATHNTHGSGVHKLTVDTNGDGVMQAGEASRLFLVASGTAQTSDTGQVGQNYSVQDRPSGNVFVYFYGDPDGNGIGLWTRLDNGDTAANPGTALTDRDGATLNSIVDWDYYNATGITAGQQATTANTALGFVTSIAAQVWEFQMGQSSASDQTWSAARTWAGDHTARGSNTSRMASLAETLALYAANFGGSGSVNTVGAVEAMSNSTSTTTADGENNAPGGWGNNIWTAAPTPSGNAVVSLISGHVLDELGSAATTYRVSAVL
jgi:hypothetical protein